MDNIIKELIGAERVVDFADRLGVSSKTVYLWLAGDKVPRTENLIKLAKVATVPQMMRLLGVLEILSDGDARVTELTAEIEQLQAHLSMLKMRAASRGAAVLH